MTTFQPSPYQQRIFDWVGTGSGSAVVLAVAGAGKTTTILRGLERVRPGTSVLLLAFNSSIAAELRQRVEAVNLAAGVRIEAKTFHALGYGAVRKHLTGVRVAADSKKSARLLRDALGERDHDLYASFAADLISLAKGAGIGAVVPDTDEAWWELVRHHDLTLDSVDADEATGVAVARDLLRRSNAAARSGDLDFDDQLYLPLLWRLRLWQHDWVIVDEAQDTSPTRRALAKLALRPGGRLLAVGDDRQAIYGWTGASHDAIDQLRRDFNATTLPLTVSYRCARRIVEEARTIVDHVEAAPTAPEGEVLELELAAALERLTDRDAIVCRNVAPLVALAYALVARGRGCRLRGRDIGTGLVKLVQKQRARSLSSLEEKLRLYRDREVAKFTARGEELKAEAVADRVACLEVVIAQLPETERTVPALVRWLEGLFGDDDGRPLLSLMTAHRSKGLEFDTVAVLAPELMPSKWARQEWQQRQEENLRYVVVTRARQTLIYLTGER